MKFRERLLLYSALLALLVTVVAGAQTSQSVSVSAPSFEVASIKVNRTPPTVLPIRFPGPSGEFTATIAAKGLIMLAYNLQAFQVSGAPNWALSTVYDIDAKEDSATAANMAQLPPSSASRELGQCCNRCLRIASS